MTTKSTPKKPAAKPNRSPGKAARKAPRRAGAGKAASRPRSLAKAATGRAVKAPGAARTGTKQAELIAMLSRAEGATIAEIMTATGWQAHTVRGAIAGALKKRLGLTVTSEKVEDRGRVYRIES